LQENYFGFVVSKRSIPLPLEVALQKFLNEFGFFTLKQHQKSFLGLLPSEMTLNFQGNKLLCLVDFLLYHPFDKVLSQNHSEISLYLSS